MAIGRVNTGGGGSGGTLVVTGIAGHTVTATAGDKTYTRTINPQGKAVFKGLASGEWVLTMQGGGQTATRRITITADYAVTITYFAATLNITYPANSNCTVSNAAGQQIATDANATASPKTWACTVGAADTYTIKAESTTGDGKTKSTTAQITSDGQSVAVTLAYELLLFDNGAYAPETGGWANSKGGTPIENKLLKSSSSCFNYTGTGSVEDSSNVYTKKEIDLSAYSTLVFTIERCPSEEGNTEVRAGGAKARVQNGKYTSGGELSLDISEISTAKVEIYSSTFSVSGGKTQTVLFKKIVCR